jgi:hypothetical protein
MNVATRPLLLLVAALVISISVSAQPADTSGCPQSQFTEWGAYGMVTPGDANNLRDEPSTGGVIIGSVEPGKPFRVVYRGSVCADGYLWREVETLTQRGWTVEIPVDGDEPFIVPYEAPEPREVGELQEDGTYIIDQDGLHLVVPAEFGIKSATVSLDPGLYGDGMSSQPDSVEVKLRDGDGDTGMSFEIFPYLVDSEIFELYWGYLELDALLDERPPLLEYAAENRMPQAPIGGVAATFGGAPHYLDGEGSEGLRYLTYFAQDSVIFDVEMVYTYMYRGFTANRAYFVTADFGVVVPGSTIPAPVDRYSEGYRRYLREFEANLAAQPTSAFRPDLSHYDRLMASVVVTDPDAFFSLLR